MAITKLDVGIRENSYSVANNSSNITVSATITWSWGTWNAEGSAYGYLTIDGTQYNFSGITFNTSGADRGSETVMTKTVDVYHASDGSKTVSVSAFFHGTNTNEITGSGSLVLTNIPRQATLSSAPNFTDEDNPVINYNNPAGNSVSGLQAAIYSADGARSLIGYRDVPKTASAYTFTLTASERLALQNYTPNANSAGVRFYLKTTIGANTYYSYLNKTLTIANCAPTLSPTVKDTNSVSIALTGSSAKLIRYISNASVTTGAKALKGASITSQTITNGGITVSGSTASFEGISAAAISISVKDSRGNTTAQTLNPTMIAYVRPTANLSLSNISAIGGNLTLGVSGFYYSGSFGVKTNSAKIEYRYKAQGSDWGAWTALTNPTVADNKYSVETALSGLNYQTQYVFQARITDLLGSATTPETPIQSKPVFDWGKDDFNINGTLKINEEAVAAYPIEIGTSSGWTYRKWNNGVLEQWNNVNVAFGSWTAWGNQYQGIPNSTTYFGLAFTGSPCLTITCVTSAWAAPFPQSVTSTGFDLYAARPYQGVTTSPYTFSVYAIGKWK